MFSLKSMELVALLPVHMQTNGTAWHSMPMIIIIIVTWGSEDRSPNLQHVKVIPQVQSIVGHTD